MSVFTKNVSWMFVFSGLLTIYTIEGSARSFRVNMLPNGNVFSCNTCHTTGYGGSRNAFGLDVQKLVTPGGNQTFWSVELAALDSDGDGVPNGAELGDPAGTWVQGDPNPGSPSAVTNPGDPKSLSDVGPISPADAWGAVLSGKNVVSPIDTPAKGTAVLLLHEPEKKLVYYLNVFNLDSVTAAHIHLGMAGENGGVVHPLATPAEGSSSGTIDVTDEDIANLKSGLFYVQVHTEQNPGGELRGQITDDPLKFHAVLDNKQVVGGVNSPGMGSMIIELNNEANKIAYTLTVSNLSGITASHIHVGARGENGDVVIPIVSEAFTEITGAADITPEILENLLAERLYINVHTTQNPSGEIRGQITFNDPMDRSSSISGWSLYE